METVLSFTGLGGGEPSSGILLFLTLVWVLPWKGYALWVAAKRSEKWWFIALLVINTLGLLEIFYLFVVAKKKDALIAFFKNILD